MKTSAYKLPMPGKTLIAAAVASLLLVACAAAPVRPDGADAARARLTQLQNNPELATRAPVSMKDAEVAVRIAEQPQTDVEIGKYNVYMADRKVDIAVAQAETALAVDQRVGLAHEQEKARLDARTREADLANSKLANARDVIANQKNQAADAAALAAQQAADAAALQAAQQNAEMQRQLDEMHAKMTDRGAVLTLGDVLFATGRADLKVGATNNLDRLVVFLTSYPNRTVVIEGYTDNIGGDEYNMALSQRRSDSVKAYLTGQGIGSERLTSTGKGLSNPIAGNGSAEGRQQNRRVEVIISNSPVAMR